MAEFVGKAYDALSAATEAFLGAVSDAWSIGFDVGAVGIVTKIMVLLQSQCHHED